MILGMEGAIVGGERYLEQITTMVLNHGNVSSDHSGSVTEISTYRSQKILLDHLQKVLLEQNTETYSFFFRNVTLLEVPKANESINQDHLCCYPRLQRRHL